MEDGVRPWWGGVIIDEEELSPEERARLPWNDPDGFPGERPYHIGESPSGLQIIVEEDWGFEEQGNTEYEEEKPDINLIYGYYEESEFY